MLLPPGIEDFNPLGHFVGVINDVAETFAANKIEACYSCLGQTSYHPPLLLRIFFMDILLVFDRVEIFQQPTKAISHLSI